MVGMTGNGTTESPCIWRSNANTPAVIIPLPSGYTTGTAWDVSDDGSVVVGTMTNADGTSAFRWTQQTGVELIPNFEDFFVPYSYGGTRVAVDASGVYVDLTQKRVSDGAQKVFRWSKLNGLEYQEQSAELGGWAYDIYDDGSVIVGSAFTDPGTPSAKEHACMWQNRKFSFLDGDLITYRSAADLCAMAEHEFLVGLFPE